MKHIKIRTLFWTLAVLLFAVAIVMINLSIYFSSVPDHEQDGWAIAFGVDAAFVALGGALCALYAESTDARIRQLDYDRAQEVEVT